MGRTNSARGAADARALKSSPIAMAMVSVLVLGTLTTHASALPIATGSSGSKFARQAQDSLLLDLNNGDSFAPQADYSQPAVSAYIGDASTPSLLTSAGIPADTQQGTTTAPLTTMGEGGSPVDPTLSSASASALDPLAAVDTIPAPNAPPVLVSAATTGATTCSTGGTTLTTGAGYKLTDLLQNDTFFNNFDFETSTQFIQKFGRADPTHGYVNYVCRFSDLPLILSFLFMAVV